ncbi:hypothetical protein SBI67_17865 [Mycolicibacterium sp. 120266]|nr:hypothetical protein [Mycolicibacterium sp. 120266]MDX1873992.1 hypothetical protein [Mycolicibacterium sp. 120266]
MTTTDLPIFYRCPSCARPVSPWQPEVCSRCRGEQERRDMLAWIEDNN